MANEKKNPAPVRLKNGQTRWRGRVDVGRDPISGKRLQRTITAGTAKEWATLATRARASARDGIAERSPSRLTVGRYLTEDWLSHRQAGGTIRDATFLTYRGHVNRHLVPAFGATKLTALRTVSIQRWVDGQAGSSAPSTIRARLGTLDQAMRQAVRWQLITRNPCDGVRAPAVRPAPRQVWDVAAVEEFLARTAGRPYHAAWCILARTGLRIGELVALLWADVDLSVPVIHVRRTATRNRAGSRVMGTAPKTEHGVRDVLLDAATAAAIGALPRRSVFVIAGQGSRMISDQTLRDHLTADCAWLGLARITPHALRHGHGTNMMSADIHPSIAMQRLGHGSMAMMARYTHPTLGHQQRVIERLRAGGRDQSRDNDGKEGEAERRSG